MLVRRLELRTCVIILASSFSIHQFSRLLWMRRLAQCAMEAMQLFKSLDRNQRNTFFACFLGWALDAFDFFLLTFVIVPMAGDFGKSIAELTYAITLTLAMRPLGAFIFGLLGDRFGRRIPLMIDVIFYSVMELLTAFSPNYTWLLIFRALYGIGMGGEWGLGASLAMESVPTAARGLFSGILQQGYAFGYLLAAIVYWIVFPFFGWRGLFVAGALPAFLVLYIRARVPESPVWLQRQHERRDFWCDLRRNSGWSSVAKMGTPSLDYFDRDIGHNRYSSLGFSTRLRASCHRWVC